MKATTTVGMLVAAAALAIASSARAAVMFDYGTDAGQYNNTNGISVWGGWGTAPTVSFSADTVDMTYPALGAWSGGGAQLRNGTAYNSIDVSNIDPNGHLSINARLQYGDPVGSTYYIYTLNVGVIASNGHSATYHFMSNNGWVNGSAPLDSNIGGNAFTLVAAQETLNGTGSIVWGTDTITGIDVGFSEGAQAASSPITIQLDSLQFDTLAPVPEPASLGLLGLGGLALLRRRR